MFHWEITKLMKQGGSWKNSLFPICSCDAVSQWELWGCGHSRSLCLLCMWEPFSHLSSPFHVFLSPVNLSVTGHLLPLHSPPCYIYGVTIFTDYRSVPPYLRGLRKRTPTNEFLLMFTQSKASMLPGNMWGIGVWLPLSLYPFPRCMHYTIVFLLFSFSTIYAWDLTYPQPGNHFLSSLFLHSQWLILLPSPEVSQWLPMTITRVVMWNTKLIGTIFSMVVVTKAVGIILQGLTCRLGILFWVIVLHTHWPNHDLL